MNTARRVPIKDLSITKKITLYCVITSLISLIIAITAISVYDRKHFAELMEDELKVFASILSNRSTAAIVFDDEALAANNLKTLEIMEAIVAGCVFKIDTPPPAGTISRLASYPSETANCPAFTPMDTVIMRSQDGQFTEIVEPIVLDQTIVGYVYLKSSTAALRGQQTDHLKVMLTVTAIAIVIAFLLANQFARWLSAPLYHLGKTARLIADEDNFSLRAKKYNNDEVGEVVDSFNRMLDVIQQEDAELRESEEKFRMISASSKVGIFQLDIGGNYIYANEELAAITDLSTDVLLNQGWRHVIHPDDRPIVDSKWNNMLNNHQPINISCRLQCNGIKWITCHVGLLNNNLNDIVGFLGSVNDITDIKNAQVQLEQMAFYDTLTGLANRRLFRNRLEHVLNNLNREGHKLGLILLDLDNFKNVNDSLGHDSGDSLLTIIAERLQQCVRASDTVARLGGDEFAIILPGINGSIAISNVAQKILDHLRNVIVLQETEFRITASAGISMAPDDSDNAEGLIKNADLALYRAKDHGRNNYQFFTAEMNIQLLNHLQLIEDLRGAITKQEFSLVYQPQIDLKNGQLIGFEALIRWDHPLRGPISPMDFIPAAEETGLIIPLGRWVITAACQQLHKMCSQGVVDEDVAITVNLSVQQFQDEELVGFIEATLFEFDLKAKQFEVEVTETVLMENLDTAIDKLDALKRLGIKISIDDFGTGYSSLGYLKQLPVHIVKVDRSFVTDIPHDKDDMAITAAVIAMAHELNYVVVAEGVETEAQLQFLEQCHCDYGQGYYFSKPIRAEELPAFCQSFSLTELRQAQL